MKISLKAARVNSKLTQKQVAEALKVSRATIYSWEKGDFLPNIAQAKQLEKIFGISINDIIFFDGDYT